MLSHSPGGGPRAPALRWWLHPPACPGAHTASILTAPSSEHPTGPGTHHPRHCPHLPSWEASPGPQGLQQGLAFPAHRGPCPSHPHPMPSNLDFWVLQDKKDPSGSGLMQPLGAWLASDSPRELSNADSWDPTAVLCEVRPRPFQQGPTGVWTATGDIPKKLLMEKSRLAQENSLG